MESVRDTKYANRSRLEVWANRHDARVQYRRDVLGWTVAVAVPQEPETIIFESETHDWIEAGCVEVMGYIGEAGLNAPE